MNTPEPTDSTGHGADPHRRDPYDPAFGPTRHDAAGHGSEGHGGATDLLDFPPLPPYPDPDASGSGYPQAAAPGYPGGDQPVYPGADDDFAALTAPEFPQRQLTGQPQSQPGAGTGSGPVPGGVSGTETGTRSGAGLRLVSDAEATARLVIKLPSAPPQPSTTLRPHAAWEDRDADGNLLPDGVPVPRRGSAPTAPFAQVAASPARPTALPAELAALTTATLVVPLPRASRPTPALLTTTLPPDKAAQANAALLEDAFHDTLEQVFGLDLEKASPADVGLAPQADYAGYQDALDAPDALDESAADLPGAWFRDEAGPARPGVADPGFAGRAESEPDFDVDQAPYEYVPGIVPAATFGGPYGVPTQPAAFPGFAARYAETHDPSRHALALRYLGGIFHDSSGEASYVDPGAFTRAGLAPAAALAAAPSVPPDAPTETISRIPALDPPGAGPSRQGPDTAVRASAGTAASESAAAAAASTETTTSGESARAAEGHGDGRGRSRLVTLLALVVAAFAILYGLALVLASGVFGGDLPRGTAIGGVAVGGMSPDAARQVVATELEAQADQPLALQIGQTPVALDPAKAGLSLDVAATVQAAQNGRTNPLVIIPALFGGGREIAPVTAVDSAALARALGSIAKSYDTPMVEGRITFRGGVPQVTAPRQGRGFNLDGAAEAIATGYLRVGGPIRIPVQAVMPKATPAALQDALANLARPAVSAPISLVTGNTTTDLTPARIGDALVIAPGADGRMTPRLDGAKLRGYLGSNALAQEQPATNASFDVNGDVPALVPARDGRGFAPAALVQALQPVLTQAAPRRADVPLGPLPAAFTTADAQALGVTDVLGSSTLPVADAPDRFANVQRATALVSGGVVRPGQTWSFLKTVGAPTTANGFAVTSSAARAGVDPSGGVDTVATAVFDAAFSSGMGDAVHHPHASYIDRFPVGLDAAVVAPSTDLRWTNTSGHPVYVYASYANQALTVALLGEKSYDSVKVDVSQRTSIVQPSGRAGSSCAGKGVPGFQVDVTRTLIRGGAQAGAEQYHVTYLPQSGAGCSSSGTGTTPGGAVGGSTGGTGGAVSTGPTAGTGGGRKGGSGGSGTGPSAPPVPSPSPTGILGGLLH